MAVIWDSERTPRNRTLTLKSIRRACGCRLERIPNSRSSRAPRGRWRAVKFCKKHKPDRFLSGFIAGFIVGAAIRFFDKKGRH